MYNRNNYIFYNVMEQKKKKKEKYKKQTYFQVFYRRGMRTSVSEQERTKYAQK